VTARLAGGSDFKDATAGKPDCYRGIDVGHVISAYHKTCGSEFIRERFQAIEILRMYRPLRE
jgi:hypothetical protein